MENVRHQFVELHKYDGALQVAQRLSEGGANFNDDAVYGYALARAAVYAFSDRQTEKGPAIPGNLALEDRIALEARNPKPRQGAEICGRETRGMLHDFGFVAARRLTTTGSRLIKAKARGNTYFDIWRRALLGFQLRSSNSGQVFNPARIVLRILDADQGLSRAALALALEARNNSATDLRRLLPLVPRSKHDLLDLQQHYGLSRFRNASKVIPGLCERVGFIQRPKRSAPYTSTDVGCLAVGSNYRNVSRSNNASSGAPGVASLVAYDPRRARRFTESSLVSIRTPNEQREAVRIRRERTVRHERARELFGHFLFEKGFRLFDRSTAFGSLAIRSGCSILVEVKSLERDALERTRAAVSQLLYYRFVKVETRLARKLHLVTVFDRKLPSYLAKFLDQLNIGAFAAQGRVVALNYSANDLMQSF